MVVVLSPLLGWFKKVKSNRAYELFFIGCFLAAIPLKIAWVTFTTLSLLAYSLYHFYQNRRFNFGAIQISLLLFFIVPLLFLGGGDFQ